MSRAPRVIGAVLLVACGASPPSTRTTSTHAPDCPAAPVLDVSDSVDLDVLERDARALEAASSPCNDAALAAVLGSVARRLHTAAQSDDPSRAEAALFFYDASLARRSSGDEAAELAFYAAQLASFRLARPLDAASRYLSSIRASPTGPHAIDANLELLDVLGLLARECRAEARCADVEPLATEAIDRWLVISVGREPRVAGLLRAVGLEVALGQREAATRLAQTIADEAPGSTTAEIARELAARAR